MYGNQLILVTILTFKQKQDPNGFILLSKAKQEKAKNWPFPQVTFIQRMMD